jgi:alpha-tubulin suppressor-like RCC1 family protein
MNALKPFSRTGLLSAVALAALGIVSSAAPAAMVDATYNSATDVPVTASGYMATGDTVNFTLNFAPATGTDLMVVQNTGLDFISGTFDNLTNGQAVALSYGATTYSFVANYYGGNGNDLVLLWANRQVVSWGLNGNGQLGDNTTSNHLQPMPVTATGVLAGKTVVAIAAGGSHSLALCSDGTVAAWGWNYFGQIGDNTTTNRLAPVAVNTATNSALYGRTVVAIAAGGNHSLALCSDGTVVAWGRNFSGQLGDGSTTQRSAPVVVNAAPGSALHGMTVVAISGGGGHSLALCADGTVAAWGYNADGELGDNSNSDRHIPVAVNTASASALQGQTVVAIAAGGQHSLALCSDGTMAAWGWNGWGQLGNNTVSWRLVPGAVNIDSGVSALADRTVVAIGAGNSHNLALCSDGTVAAWGANDLGQLGDKTGGDDWARRLVPVAVNTDPGVSALSSKVVMAIARGNEHGLALCGDGTLAAWGYNDFGQLGDNTTTSRLAPVAVNAATLAAGARFACVAGADHTIALVALPATEIIWTGAKMLDNGSFQFAFTNTPGAFFSVLVTTNPATPLSNWTTLGAATEVSPGLFKFTNPQATNTPQRFYRVRSP